LNVFSVSLCLVHFIGPISVFRCGKFLKRNARSSTTSNLLNHQRDCSPKSDLRPQQGLMRSFVSGSTYKREKLRALTALWVTRHRRPFRIVQDPEFHEIIRLLNPLAHTHSASTQARDVQRLYKLSRQKTRIFLAVSSTLRISTPDFASEHNWGHPCLARRLDRSQHGSMAWSHLLPCSQRQI
jgi:hypothetical protein